MATVAGGPRLLLRRLREVMADQGTAQSRLDKIVRIIAANMVAEVCSIYLRRAGNMLELYATEGLNPEAVHKTQLKFGEGLVGDIAAHARPLNLSDAPTHPNFAYRPETGEDPFHSLMGVPIMRAGAVAGVLVVQNQTMRHYTEEEVEALQTVAMVLAEMVGTGKLIDLAELAETATAKPISLRFKGLAIADGIARGRAVLHEPRVEVGQLLAEDPDKERERLEDAIFKLRDNIDAMLEDRDLAHQGEHREVLETYRMFAHDRGWLGKLMEAVSTGLTAEAAVERVQLDMHARMSAASDAYLRERVQDLDDLANRLLRILAGKGDTAAHDGLPDDAIIVARQMGPAELLDYDRSKVKGVVIEEGSATSHVAIVARALDIPLVGRVDHLVDKVDQNDWIIVDGSAGEVVVRPGPELLTAYGEKMVLRAQAQAAYAAIRDLPAISKDGVKISLNVNAGLLVDLPHLDESGADGIGLFRTELQFMIGSAMPRLAAQEELYRAVLDAAGNRRVVFRTLDIGSDKTLPYMVQEREENPALGWRAIRIALDRPAFLRYQVRALLAAAAGRELNLMFPMISNVAEFVTAKAMVMREVDRLEKLGREGPAMINIGTMLEVPALVFQLNALLPLTDFLSVGSNDLMQFFFASDRGNPKLADRYDPLSPAGLSLLSHIARTSANANVPATLCGELAGRPLEAMALIGAGFRSISMPPASVGPVKMMVRSLEVEPLTQFMNGLVDRADESVRGHLHDFARDHQVSI